jgi:hypothetical protein
LFALTSSEGYLIVRKGGITMLWTTELFDGTVLNQKEGATLNGVKFSDIRTLTIAETSGSHSLPFNPAKGAINFTNLDNNKIAPLQKERKMPTLKLEYSYQTGCYVLDISSKNFILSKLLPDSDLYLSFGILEGINLHINNLPLNFRLKTDGKSVCQEVSSRLPQFFHNGYTDLQMGTSGAKALTGVDSTLVGVSFNSTIGNIPVAGVFSLLFSHNLRNFTLTAELVGQSPLPLIEMQIQTPDGDEFFKLFTSGNTAKLSVPIYTYPG